MSAKIHILPEHISQMIAAGEVVERPASVVKELMENAIDAGASEITVELKTGGLQVIRVIDNGEGMDPEDVPLALQRFATSKIRKVEDLYTIQTLGFRGEALPSIASVSQMTIKTRGPHCLVGTKVVCEGGEIKSISEIGFPMGTEVEVKNIFYNIPVKRKFLKSIRSELRYTLNHFLRISLSHPRIFLKLIHDGRILQELLKSESPMVRIEALLGREMTDHLKAVEWTEGGIHISGFTSLPSMSKGNGDGIYIYINQRYVKDRIIYKAMIEVYRHRLPVGKFPVVILFITLPPSAVDVNVHPTKAEVKFKEPERIYQTVFTALRGVLEEGGLRLEELLSEEDGRKEVFPERIQPSFRFRETWRGSYGQGDGEKASIPMVQERREPPWEMMKRVPFRLLGQIWGTYILCEVEGSLMIIDQHAAHERILFEKFKNEFEKGSVSSEKLLIPLLMELTMEESLILASAEETFQTIGFEIEPIGERLYAIRSIPSLLDQKDSKEVVREVLEELSLLQRGGEGRATFHTFLVSLACHSAIRGNFILRREEMEELVENLYPFNTSATCPHGRPIFLLVSLEELNKQFRRR